MMTSGWFDLGPFWPRQANPASAANELASPMPDSRQLKPYVPLIFGTVVMFGAAVLFGVFIGWMIWGR
jgi:hypothetical protein